MAALLLSVLTGCTEDLPESRGLTGTVTVAGSSTLTPLVLAVSDEWVAEVEPGVTVALSSAGTRVGVARLCEGDADLAMTSRPMTEEETVRCAGAGVEPVAVPLGRDAVTLVVPRRNDHVRCLDVAELAGLMADADDAPSTWADVRPGWPTTALALFAPGPSSGTADVLDATVLDGVGKRADVATSEDDRVVVQGVAASPGGFGYVPLTYATDAADLVRPVALDAGDGCVEPSARTVADGSYALSRSLQVYVSAGAYAERPAVAALVDHLVDRSAAAARELGGVPPSPEQEQEQTAALRELRNPPPR